MDVRNFGPPLGESATTNAPFMKTYFGLTSGTLKFDTRTRYIAMGIQFFLLLSFSASAALYTWWIDTKSSFTYLFGIFAILASWLGLAWWSIAFYLSVRASVPRFVSTKNTLGLFSFTFLVFETFVLTLLLWFLYFLYWYTNATKMCAHKDYFCEGLVRGAFVFLNTLLLVLGLVLWNLRKQLGIGIMEALGMSQ